MGFKIKNVSGNPFEKKGPKLCCTLNKDITCTYCNLVMCEGCGKAWSPAKHFILDMCRSRFTPEELAEAGKCYADRIKAKKENTPGSCKVCVERIRTRGNDRKYNTEEDTSGWPFQDDFDIDAEELNF